jgi:hypothetical protein
MAVFGWQLPDACASQAFGAVMTNTETTVKGALLVGSIPLSNAEGVFRLTSEILGDRLRRVPDGETGGRLGWIYWQSEVFRGHPDFVPLEVNEIDHLAPIPRFRVKDSVAPSAVTFGEMGYAREAKISYDVFSRLKREGVIPSHVRFQISLPTPIATVAKLVDIEQRAKLEEPFTKAMLADVNEICGFVPHNELSIQWDVSVEFAIWEKLGGGFSGWWDDAEQAIIDHLAQIGDAILADVELGYHLCYGDYKHAHFVEPRDCTTLVEVANRISAAVSRTIEFIHLPVPIERDDPAFFAPLADLTLHPETELYLGLVHLRDGVDGAKRRIRSAQRYLPTTFGVYRMRFWPAFAREHTAAARNSPRHCRAIRVKQTKASTK